MTDLFQVEPGRHLLVERQGRPAGEVVPLDGLEVVLLGLGFELGDLPRPGHADEAGDGQAELEAPVADEQHADELAVDVDERPAAELVRARASSHLEDLACGAEVHDPAEGALGDDDLARFVGAQREEPGARGQAVDGADGQGLELALRA